MIIISLTEDRAKECPRLWFCTSFPSGAPEGQSPVTLLDSIQKALHLYPVFAPPSVGSCLALGQLSINSWAGKRVATIRRNVWITHQTPYGIASYGAERGVSTNA